MQVIIATHSEYVIQSALKDRDNVLWSVKAYGGIWNDGHNITVVRPIITINKFALK